MLDFFPPSAGYFAYAKFHPQASKDNVAPLGQRVLILRPTLEGAQY
jgi:hypothetical protein